MRKGSCHPYLCNWNRLEGVQAEVGDMTTDFGQARVNHKFHAVDGDGSFRNIRSEDNLHNKHIHTRRQTHTHTKKWEEGKGCSFSLLLFHRLPGARNAYVAMILNATDENTETEGGGGGGGGGGDKRERGEKGRPFGNLAAWV
jgi:hypothetical protein